MEKKPEFVEEINPTNALAMIGIDAEEFAEIVAVLVRAAVSESLNAGLKELKGKLTPNQIDAVLIIFMKRIRGVAVSAIE